MTKYIEKLHKTTYIPQQRVIRAQDNAALKQCQNNQQGYKTKSTTATTSSYSLPLRCSSSPNKPERIPLGRDSQ
jgi:hypothetical protein